VYFHTGPMRAAVRGEPLDMDAARADPPPRRHVPLTAPARTEDVAARVARWRERRPAAAALDPPGAFLDAAADGAGEGLRGRLHVPDGGGR
jgi:hypothetical protein